MLHIPQQGCEACRMSRKVCDLQRPKCGACAANSLACIDRRDQVDFAFVDENNAAVIASRRAAGRRSRRVSRRGEFSSSSNLPVGQALHTSRNEQSPISVSPVLNDLDDVVIRRFFSRWADRQTCLGCFDSIPTVFEAAAEHSAMKTAILATAYADLTVFERHGDRGRRSYQAYQATLRRLQVELSSPNFVASDTILTAILTIDSFEQLYLGRADPLGIHTKAIARLLELRKNVLAADQQNYELWRSAYQRLCVRQIFCELPSLGYAGVNPSIVHTGNHPEVETVKLAAEACNFMSQIRNEREKPAQNMDSDEVIRLSTDLRSLLQRAGAFARDDNSMQQPRRVPFNAISNELKEAFPNETVLVYDSIMIARDRLLFQICCVKALDILIDLQAEEFSSRLPIYNRVEATRTFLLEVQSDLVALHQKCRFILDTIPLILDLVLPNGMNKVDPWYLNDTGVLTVRSPLKTIASLKFMSGDIQREANAILKFFDRHRYVIQ